MKIRFVTSTQIKVELEGSPGWSFRAEKWHGLYMTRGAARLRKEIWINKEENLFHVIETLFHEVGHWFMDLAGLDRFNLHYEVVSHFFKLGELPTDKRRSMSAYYSEIKQAP